MNLMLRLLGTALGVGGVVALTFAMFGLPVSSSIDLLTQGAIGDSVAWTRTLVKATPLLLCALGTLIAWRAGMFNIGGEGQFLVGGLSGALFAKLCGWLPPALLNIGILAACVAGGALYAALAGWLHVRRGVQVVISTILLNFVALQLLGWAVSGPLKGGDGLPMTARLDAEAMLWRPSRQSDLHSGVFLALAAALIVFVWLFWTRPGFRLRLVGEGPRVARAARLDPDRLQLGAMALSGALCGLAGGVEFTALAGQLGNGFSQQWGFLAIPVAIVGGLHPLGAVLSALGFGALFAGSENVARFTPEGATIGYAIQGLAVLGFLVWGSVSERRAALRSGT